MRAIIILFSLCIVVIAAESGCFTFCFCEGSVASCFNAPFFPSFITTAWIQTLILIDGSMNQLPITPSSFPQLRTLVLRNCYFITCNQLEELHQNYGNLSIETDINCDDTSTVSTTISDITTAVTSESTTTVPVPTTTQVTDTSASSVPTLSTTSVSTDSTTGITRETTTTDHGTDNRHTVLLASILSVGGVVILVVIVLVSVLLYKKFSVDRVRPIVRPNEEIYMDPISYINRAYESCV